MTDTDYHKNEDGREIALEARANEEDRLFSPSAARNREVIAGTFAAQMPHDGLILEVGSGTGEHAVSILKAVPGLDWQPSDPDMASRRSVDGWARHERLDRLKLALNIDVTRPEWWEDGLEGPFAGLVSINMIHIAPFTAASGLFAGAGKLLGPGAKLFLYGPFMRQGETAPSNIEFDRSLKSRDASWGVRDIDRELVPLAIDHGLSLTEVIEMPANNHSVIFTRSA